MRKAETEKKEFLELCGERDRKFLTEPETMSLGEFDRLTYITDFLGYEAYGIELWNTVSGQFKQQFDNLSKLMQDCEPGCSVEETESEIKLHGRWLKDFVEQIPDEKAKGRIEQKIRRSYKERGWEAEEQEDMP